MGYGSTAWDLGTSRIGVVQAEPLNWIRTLADDNAHFAGRHIALSRAFHNLACR